ncbi:class I SAM-dependent methyltransferase [Actinomycetospora lemnae]|uniref:50S ribosomal protein L11 methyltransferase n=1 Tax=Actinomycetospora lemnae TaxID=3019891 RepID=A0ABT5T220_9PSEU|nr:50S ribosomal protein L11 methyltransferase [Actinomycetospora sp. DW7H6]MDD7969054.1 50S ribosomal protein L11 methyltransferase [Actinomycetospora sp. DW7H6]
MTDGDTGDEDAVRDWTAPGTAPLVGEITLLLADDIHRTWSALDEEAPPFWAFAWVGGQALARHVLDHPDLVRGRRVLDLASGSGIVAIAAALAGAEAVIASDTDARSRTAVGLNAAANGVDVAVVGDVLDGDHDLDVDVVLAGDVFYEQPMARHMERFCDEASAAGVDVVVGDPGREYLPRRRCTALASYDVTGTADLEGGSTTRTTVYRFT